MDLSFKYLGRHLDFGICFGGTFKYPNVFIWAQPSHKFPQKNIFGLANYFLVLKFEYLSWRNIILAHIPQREIFTFTFTQNATSSCIVKIFSRKNVNTIN
jgi:hypothetical protein